MHTKEIQKVHENAPYFFKKKSREFQLFFTKLYLSFTLTFPWTSEVPSHITAQADPGVFWISELSWVHPTVVGMPSFLTAHVVY